MPRLHSVAAIDRPEVTHLTLPPTPEVVWQQTQEAHLTNINNVLTNETHKDHKTKLIQTKTEPLRNKQVFIKQY